MPRCEMCDEWLDCPWKTDPEIICGEYRPKPMTNADRIRSMTDEELAEWLWGEQANADAGGTHGYRGWLDWLKSPAEEDK